MGVCIGALSEWLGVYVGVSEFCAVSWAGGGSRVAVHVRFVERGLKCAELTLTPLCGVTVARTSVLRTRSRRART